MRSFRYRSVYLNIVGILPIISLLLPLPTVFADVTQVFGSQNGNSVAIESGYVPGSGDFSNGTLGYVYRIPSGVGVDYLGTANVGGGTTSGDVWIPVNGNQNPDANDTSLSRTVFSRGHFYGVGASNSSLASGAPTYWDGLPSNPVAANNNLSINGALTDATTYQGNLIFVGISANAASIGTPGFDMQPLQGSLPVVALDISANAEFIGGQGAAWRRNGTGVFDYGLFDTSHFSTGSDLFSYSDTWDLVEESQTGSFAHVFVGEALSSNFDNVFAAWNENGGDPTWISPAGLMYYDAELLDVGGGDRNLIATFYDPLREDSLLVDLHDSTQVWFEDHFGFKAEVLDLEYGSNLIVYRRFGSSEIVFASFSPVPEPATSFPLLVVGCSTLIKRRKRQ